MTYIVSHACNINDMPQVGLRIQTRFALPLVSVFFRWNTEDNMEKDQQVLKHPIQPNFSYFVPLVSPFPFSPQYWGIAPTIAARERRSHVFSNCYIAFLLFSNIHCPFEPSSTSIPDYWTNYSRLKTIKLDKYQQSVSKDHSSTHWSTSKLPPNPERTKL